MRLNDMPGTTLPEDDKIAVRASKSDTEAYHDYMKKYGHIRPICFKDRNEPRS